MALRVCTGCKKLDPKGHTLSGCYRTFRTKQSNRDGKQIGGCPQEGTEGIGQAGGGAARRPSPAVTPIHAFGEIQDCTPHSMTVN